MPVTTTDETWAVNGTILNKLAYNFSGLGGRLDGPAIRGANSPSPIGADRFRQHWYGPRLERWTMWVSEHDPATDLPGGRAQASANLDTIKALFQGNVSVPLAVTRIVRLPTVGLTTRTAQAVCTKIVDEPNLGAAFHRVTLDVEIPSGLWSGASASSAVTTGTFTMPGTATVVPTLLTLGGACSIVNATTATGFTYTGGACTFTPALWQTSPAAAIADVVPTSAWPLLLAPGANALTVTGSITVARTAGYL